MLAMLVEEANGIQTYMRTLLVRSFPPNRVKIPVRTEPIGITLNLTEKDLVEKPEMMGILLVQVMHSLES